MRDIVKLGFDGEGVERWKVVGLGRGGCIGREEDLGMEMKGDWFGSVGRRFGGRGRKGDGARMRVVGFVERLVDG
jgi:hypothetical protein